MVYFILKWIHIISASLLVGSFIAGVWLAYAYRHLDPTQQPTRARYLLGLHAKLGLQALLITPITAMAIIAIQHYNPAAVWVIGSAVGFLIFSVLWLAGILQLYRATLPTTASEHLALSSAVRRQTIVFSLWLPVCLLLIYLMSNRPT